MRNVVYACDDKYIEQTIISMASLLVSNPYPVKFWIVSDHISDNNKRLITEKIMGFGQDIEFLDIEEILSGISIAEGNRHPKTIYAKLFLENVIDVDKILYLDSDTVIANSLEELWMRNMEDELAAGVQMPYSARVKSSMNIGASSPYLCDGIVLLNIKLWREKKLGIKCKRYISDYHGAPPMLSEGTLNYACQNHVGVLNPEYNLMPSMIFYTGLQIKQLFKSEVYYCEEELKHARKDPVIIHYINELYNRPWREPCDHPYRQFYRDERLKLFGPVPYERKTLSRSTMITRALKNMLPFCIFVRLYHYKHKEL